MFLLRKASYLAATAACVALAMLTSALSAQAHEGRQADWQAARNAPVGIVSSFQVTDTTDMTDTMDMTNTADMTDSMDMTDSTDMSAGTAMTDTGMMGGTGPDDALSPTGEETTLGAGETRWYTFKYDWDGESDPSEAIAELRMNTPGAIDFEVWSQDDLNAWRNGEDFTPMGAGTPAFATGDDSNNNRDRSLLRWVGSSAATVTYHLIVSNNSDSEVSFTLMVMGDTVSFPAPAEMADMGAMTETMTMTDSMAMTDTVMLMGIGPDDAMTPNGRREVITPEATRWYTFKYEWDGESDPSNVVAELRMAEAGTVSFEVWSQDDLAAWFNNEDFTPTGAGTPAFALSSDSTTGNRDRSLLRWVGGGEATVTYYILVENDSDADAVYRLSVSGRDVSFPGPAMTGDADNTTTSDDADLTDSKEMTDTMGMTDAMGMTDTVSITDTEDLTDTEEMTDTTP